MNKPKTIAIVGQTATGKSDLAVQIAKKFNGEVVSADSRQVYIGLDIGTGKITPEEMEGIAHHMLDIENPKNRFSVSEFKQRAEEAINDILSRGKMPIMCGGTGFYIQSIVDGLDSPEVPENTELRKELSELSVDELSEKLQQLDSSRHSEIDTKNKVRLIRAIEIATSLGSVPKQESNPKYNVLQIGISISDDELQKLIKERVEKRIKQGMIHEAEELHKNGLSFERMHELGLEYRYLAELLQNKISLEEFKKTLNTKIWQYAKRQKTWFKRDERIKWVSSNQKENAEKAVEEFLK